jgi:ribosomal protein L31E
MIILKELKISLMKDLKNNHWKEQKMKLDKSLCQHIWEQFRMLHFLI